MAARRSQRIRAKPADAATKAKAMTTDDTPKIPSKATKVVKRKATPKKEKKKNESTAPREKVLSSNEETGKNAALPPATPAKARAFASPAKKSTSRKGKKDTIEQERPADPFVTNAPLLSPETSRVIKYSDLVKDPHLAKEVPKPSTSTKNILEDACAHLVKVDARMKPLVEKFTCPLFTAEGLAEEIDPFRSLASSIIGQQVSGAAASSIKRKFVSLFDEAVLEDASLVNERFPKPSQVVGMSMEKLRSAGLSGRKAEYIQGIAEKFSNGELSSEMLMTASDEELMEKLIAVRGLGRWSVEMFACFALKRLDIFSTGDLGVQRGMAAFIGRDVSKLRNNGTGKNAKWKYMSEADMIELSDKFAPYRSLFMWYMWRAENVETAALES